MNAITYIKDERWYDKSSAAYFTSKSTRNAQTVSLSQRHRPIFQMYIDLQTGILICAVTIIACTLKVRQLHVAGEKNLSEHEFIDVL